MELTCDVRFVTHDRQKAELRVGSGCRHLLHDDGPIQRGSNAAHKIKGRRVGALLLLLLLLLDREQSACQTIHFRFVWRDADTLGAPNNSVGIVTTEVFEQ
jgi:hypothetical protein